MGIENRGRIDACALSYRSQCIEMRLLDRIIIELESAAGTRVWSTDLPHAPPWKVSFH